MSAYRKKPVVIEAMRYDPPNNCEQIWRFLGWPWPSPEWPAEFAHADDCDASVPLDIDTLEGLMTAQPGDWIIKGVAGEFYPCKPDIFDATYEPVAAHDHVSEPTP